MHVIMLSILQQDVMLQLIYGMERRIHPVWPCTGPSAPRLNPGHRREVRSRNPFRFAQTRSMQTATAAGEQSDVGGLARPEHRTVTQSTPNIAASPSPAPSRGQKVADRPTELHPPEAFFNFVIFSSLLSPLSLPILRQFRAVALKDRVPAWIRIDREPCQAAPDSGRPLSCPCRVMR